MRTVVTVFAVLAVTIPVYGDLGQPNDIAPYGSFELDEPGTAWPTGWDSQWGNGQIKEESEWSSPEGGQYYGVRTTGGVASGGIDIDVPNPEPDWWEKQIYVGAWVETSGILGFAGVRFSLHMDADGEYLTQDLDLYSPWYDPAMWHWSEWYVSEVSPGVPLPCLDFNINIELEAGDLAGAYALVDGVVVQHICVPEPTTLSLLALGGLALLRRRR